MFRPRILIHAPYGGKEARNGTWRALVEAQKAGKTRSIGVSNCGVHHLEELEEYIKSGVGGSIDVGQYELHPWLPRSDIVEWLRKRNVVVQAYCPLTRGQRMDEPVLQALAKKHNKTPAQILLRWSLQKVSRFVWNLDRTENLSLIMALNGYVGLCSAAEIRDSKPHRRKCGHFRFSIV